MTRSKKEALLQELVFAVDIDSIRELVRSLIEALPIDPKEEANAE